MTQVLLWESHCPVLGRAWYHEVQVHAEVSQHVINVGQQLVCPKGNTESLLLKNKHSWPTLIQNATEVTSMADSKVYRWREGMQIQGRLHTVARLRACCSALSQAQTLAGLVLAHPAHQLPLVPRVVFLPPDCLPPVFPPPVSLPPPSSHPHPPPLHS